MSIGFCRFARCRKYLPSADIPAYASGILNFPVFSISINSGCFTARNSVVDCGPAAPRVRQPTGADAAAGRAAVRTRTASGYRPPLPRRPERPSCPFHLLQDSGWNTIRSEARRRLRTWQTATRPERRRLPPRNRELTKVATNTPQRRLTPP